VAEAVAMCRQQVICAYPITPGKGRTDRHLRRGDRRPRRGYGAVRGGRCMSCDNC